MFLTTHSIIGAATALVIKNHFLAVPVNFCLHFLLDLIPHRDLGIGFEKRTKIQNLILSFIDGITGLAAVFLLFQYRRPFFPFIWLGTGINLLPDFMAAPELFFKLNLFPKINYFHNKIAHRDTPDIFWGIFPQLLIIAFCFLIAK